MNCARTGKSAAHSPSRLLSNVLDELREASTMKALILPLALVLSACASTGDPSAQWQREVDQMVQTYGPACDRLGYARDDDKWRDCVLKLADRDQRRYATFPRHTTCFGHRGFFDCTTL
jgi:hypothetical protein